MTNVLIEGGGTVLGSAFDARLIDEVHVFIAPKVVGGSGAVPCAGVGVASIADALRLDEVNCKSYQGDIHLWGRLAP